MKDQAARFPVIDAFKAIASQLIVLHHLAAYGPLSDAVQQAAPALISWLYDDARLAVQVFLVIGGFLAARTMLSSSERNTGTLTAAIFNRYLRLTVPFLAALALSIACAIIARHWLADDFIPDAPSWPQLLAHALLLQSVLDFGALSAGAWYIAIDFQLFLLMLGIVWLGRKTGCARNIVPALITLMAVASLFWFNRDASLDDWAPYFFGAYGMGAAAYWAGQRGHPGARWLWLIVPLAAIALLVDFRVRILIAVAVALTLVFARDSQRIARWAERPLPQYLSRISYSLFLVHFPVLLLANTVFTGLGFTGPVAGGIGMLATWMTSLFVANLFHRRIEKPASALKARSLLQWWGAGQLQRLRYRLVAAAFLMLAIPV